MSGRALCEIQMKGIPHLRVHLLVPESRQARLLPTRTLPWENGRESVSEVDREDLPLECTCRMYVTYARCPLNLVPNGPYGVGGRKATLKKK